MNDTDGRDYFNCACAPLACTYLKPSRFGDVRITEDPVLDPVTCQACITAAIVNSDGLLDGVKIASTSDQSGQVVLQCGVCTGGTTYRDANGKPLCPTHGGREAREIAENYALYLLGNALKMIATFPRRFVNTPGRRWRKPLECSPDTEFISDGHTRMYLLDDSDRSAPYVHPRDAKDALEDLEDLLAD